MRIFLSASRSGVSRRDSCLQRLEEFTWRGVQPNQISSTYLPAARRPRRTAGKKLAREIDLWDDVGVAPETCTELGEDLSVALLLTRDRVSMSKKPQPIPADLGLAAPRNPWYCCKIFIPNIH